jgi:CubicO group peptidase (beta-lactamase class C family)
MIARLMLILLLVAAVPAAAEPLVPLPAQPADVPWPTRDWIEAPAAPPADADRLEALLDRAFAEPEDLPGTRAVIVVHQGLLVAERYADGFGPHRRFLSQSMAKTVTGALAGILVGQGRLAIDASAPVPQWKDPADPRHDITLRHLLTMTDGLEFNEAYFNPFTSDVLPMLFGAHRGDMAAYAASRELEASPGSRWVYSSGTANILSGVIRDAVGGTGAAYLQFMRRHLFEPIGLDSAVPEFDRAGTFVGSSWLHATARDWARFGLLLLRGGAWGDVRVLPEGWVDLMRSPVANSSGAYGGMTWLNAAGPEGERRFPSMPPDLFMATGHRGQVIAMVPSKDLVIVRLGRTGYQHYEELYRWLGEVIAAFPDVPG